MSDSQWVVAESLPSHKADAQALYEKWCNVADDMALLPDLNVRVVEENGVVRVEVSTELFDCMSGF